MNVHFAVESDELRHAWRQTVDGITWNARSLITVVFAFTVSSLANAAGVGGGGFLVPLFNLVLGVSLKGAMALSQASITGGAVAAGIFAMFNSHPLDSSKPLLNLDIALVIMPWLLFGVSLGVTFNQIFPDWLLVIILTILLILLSLRTIQSGMRMHKKEKQGQKEDEEPDQDELLVRASSEIPQIARSMTGRASLDSRLLVRRSVDRQHVASADSEPLPELPQSQARGSEGDEPSTAAVEQDAVPSHRVFLQGGDSGESSSTASPSAVEEGEKLDAFQMEQEEPGLHKQLQVVADSRLEEPSGAASPSEKARGKSQGIALPGEKADGQGQTPFSEASQSHGRQHRRQSIRVRLREGSKLLLLIAVWAAFLTLQILKDKFDKCSKGYFSMYGAQAAFSLLVSSVFLSLWTKHVRRMSTDEEQPLLDHSPQAHQSHGPQKLLLASGAIFLGGCMSALCGVGGGMILGPVMLELGLHPLVVASTSLLLVGASSSSATVGFALASRLDYGWGLIMFLLCTVASIVGVAGIGRIVRRSGKGSIIVFLLVFLMAAGGIMTAVFGGIRAVQNIRQGQRIGFLNLCQL